MPKVTDDEIAQAVAVWCDLAAANTKAYRGFRRAIPLMRTETTYSRKPRRRLGQLLVRRYRRDTGEVGGVRWDNFKQWLHDHMDEINFARLIVAILTLLVMI